MKDPRIGSRPPELPTYTDADVRRTLLESGLSGTVYALVMPESEEALCRVVGSAPESSDVARYRYLDMFRQPWTQKQDPMHVAYFDDWIRWSRPVLSFDPDRLPARYPTAGASEGIFKLMSEYAAAPYPRNAPPTIAVFGGDYEGFAAFAESLTLPVARIDRGAWRDALSSIPQGSQFWISQPSSIDGMVWDGFDDFASTLSEKRPDVSVIVDLSYVGAVAREHRIDLDHDCIDALVISQSKPFGGYYHRSGGVLASSDRRSLFGNRWFKNLTSIAWARDMMRHFSVTELATRYRPAQEKATAAAAVALGVDLSPCDVMVLARGDAEAARVVPTLARGAAGDRHLRVCLTPAMTDIISAAGGPGR